jgi:uncharacterized coiled-coil protein SlyX
MCLNRIKISNLEAQIRKLEKETAFEESQIEIMGGSDKIDKLNAKLDKLNERLADLQSKTDVPSSVS